MDESNRKFDSILRTNSIKLREREHVHLDVFNRFQEIRFQIDEQREELNKRIDDIALVMIDETKKYEAMYLNKPKRRSIVSLRHLTRQKALVESESNEIVETSSFRNSNESK